MFTFSKDNNNIYTLRFSGSIVTKDIIEGVELFRTTEQLPEEISLIYDLLEADFHAKEEDLNSLLEYTSFSTKQFTKVYTAIVIQEPLVTAFSYMFSCSPPYNYIIREVFSSIASAQKWILNQ